MKTISIVVFGTCKSSITRYLEPLGALTLFTPLASPVDVASPELIVDRGLRHAGLPRVINMTEACPIIDGGSAHPLAHGRMPRATNI